MDLTEKKKNNFFVCLFSCQSKEAIKNYVYRGNYFSCLCTDSSGCVYMQEEKEKASDKQTNKQKQIKIILLLSYTQMF